VARFANPQTRQNVLAIGDQAVIGGTNFLTMIAIGRWCGSEGLGIFGLGLTLISLLVATQESLITTPHTIFLARTGEESKPAYRASTLLSHLVLSILCISLFVAAAIVSLLINAEMQFTYVLASLALACPCWLLREFARRSSNAEFNFRFSLGISLIVMAVQAAGLVGLASLGQFTPATGFLVVALANLIAGLAWFFLSRDARLFSRSHFLPTLQKHWGLGKLMFVSQMVYATSFQALPWLIAFCLGTSATGVFIACEQIVRLVNPLMVGLTNVLTPRTAHAFADAGRSGVHTIVQRAMMQFAFFMALFCGAVALTGTQLLSKFFGDEYAGYANVLLVLAIAKAIEAISIGPGRGLIVFERVSDCLKADIVKFGVTLATTLLLVWQLGILGAAYGALIGSFLFSAVLIWLYWKAVVSPTPYSAEAVRAK